MADKAAIKRRLYTHNQLMCAASAFSKQADGAHEFDNAMACVLFCALSLEAALNYIGGELFPIWDDYLQLKLSPEGKLELIASHTKYQINYGNPPFQAFRAVFELRNQLAHGKTQDLSYETARHWIEYGERRWPAAKWELLCSSDNAKSLLADTEKMIVTLHEVSGVKAIPGFLLSEHVEHPKVPKPDERSE